MNSKTPIHLKLKELREAHGYSQSDLADEINISRQAISNWETGKTFPDINNLAILCRLYNTSLDQLFDISTSGTTESKHETKVDDINSSSKMNNIETSSLSQEVLPKSQNTLVEMLCIAIILTLTHQIAFLNVITPIVIIFFLRKTHRKYAIIYILSTICLLLAFYDTYTIIYHLFFNFGTATVEPV